MVDVFSSFHPTINMLYFFLIITSSIFFIHPVCLIISFICALIYSLYLNRREALRFNIAFMMPMTIITIIINPILNHEGATILFYFQDGNPFTLESAAYGISSALTLMAVINWFSCFNTIMTSDKLVYLLGRIIPALSLILSMSLRLAPRFTTQIKIIRNAQKCIGRDMTNGSLLRRIKHSLRIISIMVTWIFENSIETADSMKGRGYGLKGRTSFSIFRFDKRDLIALIFLVIFSAYIITGLILGGLYFRYYPTIKGVNITLYTISLFAAYLILCLMPAMLNIMEDLKWKAMKSKI